MARAPCRSTRVITVYGFSASGNCHKVRLLLTQLGCRLDRDYRWVETDSSRGQTRTPEFLAKNPNGRVPLLELDDGRRMAESNAILCWLAEGAPGADGRFFAGDAWQRAQTLSWMFFEQYSHEPYVAVARSILRYQPPDSPRRTELPRLLERGTQALSVMEQHLSRTPFFVAERYSIADIALYAYTHCAAEGGFSLADYPGISAWLKRVRAQPRHVPMPG